MVNTSERWTGLILSIIAITSLSGCAGYGDPSYRARTVDAGMTELNASVDAANAPTAEGPQVPAEAEAPTPQQVVVPTVDSSDPWGPGVAEAVCGGINPFNYLTRGIVWVQGYPIDCSDREQTE